MKGGKYMKVSECMCNEVCCVKPDCNVGQVAKLMCQNHVGCIPVCDDNNGIVGIVTDRDIILSSLRVTDKFRLIGYRQEEYFCIVWFDKNHETYKG